MQGLIILLEQVKIKNIVAVLLLALLSSCASLGEDEEGYTEQLDDGTVLEKPKRRSQLEKFNHAMFNFNERLDKFILKPITKFYKRIFADPLEVIVTRFFKNLALPLTIINDILQGKFKEAVENTGRFLVNTTIGIGGMFDPASDIGIKKYQSEDFGQTLAKWGVAQGPYVVLPFLGPRTLLSAATGSLELFEYNINDRIANEIGSPDAHSYAATGLDFIQLRGALLQQEDIIAGDKYEFYKQAYLQLRDYLIKDGEIEIEEEEDLDWLD